MSQISVQQFLELMAQREGRAAAQLQQLAGQEAQNQQALQQMAQTAGQGIAQPMAPAASYTAPTHATPAVAAVPRTQEIIGGVSVPKVSIPNIMQQYQQ